MDMASVQINLVPRSDPRGETAVYKATVTRNVNSVYDIDGPGADTCDKNPTTGQPVLLSVPYTAAQSESDKNPTTGQPLLLSVPYTAAQSENDKNPTAGQPLLLSVPYTAAQSESDKNPATGQPLLLSVPYTAAQSESDKNPTTGQPVLLSVPYTAAQSESDKNPTTGQPLLLCVPYTAALSESDKNPTIGQPLLLSVPYTAALSESDKNPTTGQPVLLCVRYTAAQSESDKNPTTGQPVLLCVPYTAAQSESDKNPTTGQPLLLSVPYTAAQSESDKNPTAGQPLLLSVPYTAAQSESDKNPTTGQPLLLSVPYTAAQSENDKNPTAGQPLLLSVPYTAAQSESDKNPATGQPLLLSVPYTAAQSESDKNPTTGQPVLLSVPYTAAQSESDKNPTTGQPLLLCVPYTAALSESDKNPTIGQPLLLSVPYTAALSESDKNPTTGQPVLLCVRYTAAQSESDKNPTTGQPVLLCVPYTAAQSESDKNPTTGQPLLLSVPYTAAQSESDKNPTAGQPLLLSVPYTAAQSESDKNLTTGQPLLLCVPYTAAQSESDKNPTAGQPLLLSVPYTAAQSESDKNPTTGQPLLLSVPYTAAQSESDKNPTTGQPLLLSVPYTAAQSESDKNPTAGQPLLLSVPYTAAQSESDKNPTTGQPLLLSVPYTAAQSESDKNLTAGQPVLLTVPYTAALSESDKNPTTGQPVLLSVPYTAAKSEGDKNPTTGQPVLLSVPYTAAQSESDKNPTTGQTVLLSVPYTAAQSESDKNPATGQPVLLSVPYTAAQSEGDKNPTTGQPVLLSVPYTAAQSESDKNPTTGQPLLLCVPYTAAQSEGDKNPATGQPVLLCVPYTAALSESDKNPTTGQPLLLSVQYTAAQSESDKNPTTGQPLLLSVPYTATQSESDKNPTTGQPLLLSVPYTAAQSESDKNPTTGQPLLLSEPYTAAQSESDKNPTTGQPVLLSVPYTAAQSESDKSPAAGQPVLLSVPYTAALSESDKNPTTGQPVLLSVPYTAAQSESDKSPAAGQPVLLSVPYTAALSESDKNPTTGQPLLLSVPYTAAQSESDKNPTAGQPVLLSVPYTAALSESDKNPTTGQPVLLSVPYTAAQSESDKNPTTGQRLLLSVPYTAALSESDKNPTTGQPVLLSVPDTAAQSESDKNPTTGQRLLLCVPYTAVLSESDKNPTTGQPVLLSVPDTAAHSESDKSPAAGQSVLLSVPYTAAQSESDKNPTTGPSVLLSVPYTAAQSESEKNPTTGQPVLLCVPYTAALSESDKNPTTGQPVLLSVPYTAAQSESDKSPAAGQSVLLSVPYTAAQSESDKNPTTGQPVLLSVSYTATLSESDKNPATGQPLLLSVPNTAAQSESDKNPTTGQPVLLSVPYTAAQSESDKNPTTGQPLLLSEPYTTAQSESDKNPTTGQPVLLSVPYTAAQSESDKNPTTGQPLLLSEPYTAAQSESDKNPTTGQPVLLSVPYTAAQSESDKNLLRVPHTALRTQTVSRPNRSPPDDLKLVTSFAPRDSDLPLVSDQDYFTDEHIRRASHSPIGMSADVDTNMEITQTVTAEIDINIPSTAIDMNLVEGRRRFSGQVVSESNSKLNHGLQYRHLPTHVSTHSLYGRQSRYTGPSLAGPSYSRPAQPHYTSLLGTSMSRYTSSSYDRPARTYASTRTTKTADVSPRSYDSSASARRYDSPSRLPQPLSGQSSRSSKQIGSIPVASRIETFKQSSQLDENKDRFGAGPLRRSLRDTNGTRQSTESSKSEKSQREGKVNIPSRWESSVTKAINSDKPSDVLSERRRYRDLPSSSVEEPLAKRQEKSKDNFGSSVLKRRMQKYSGQSKSSGAVVEILASKKAEEEEVKEEPHKETPVEMPVETSVQKSDTQVLPSQKSLERTGKTPADDFLRRAEMRSSLRQHSRDLAASAEQTLSGDVFKRSSLRSTLPLRKDTSESSFDRLELRRSLRKTYVTGTTEKSTNIQPDDQPVSASIPKAEKKEIHPPDSVETSQPVAEVDTKRPVTKAKVNLEAEGTDRFGRPTWRKALRGRTDRPVSGTYDDDDVFEPETSSEVTSAADSLVISQPIAKSVKKTIIADPQSHSTPIRSRIPKRSDSDSPAPESLKPKSSESVQQRASSIKLTGKPGSHERLGQDQMQPETGHQDRLLRSTGKQIPVAVTPSSAVHDVSVGDSFSTTPSESREDRIKRYKAERRKQLAHLTERFQDSPVSKHFIKKEESKEEKSKDGLLTEKSTSQKLGESRMVLSYDTHPEVVPRAKQKEPQAEEAVFKRPRSEEELGAYQDGSASKRPKSDEEEVPLPTTEAKSQRYHLANVGSRGKNSVSSRRTAALSSKSSVRSSRLQEPLDVKTGAYSSPMRTDKADVQATTELTKPATGLKKTGLIKPATESTEAAKDLVKPALELTKPATESTETVLKPSRPATELTRQGTQSRKPATELTKAETETTEEVSFMPKEASPEPQLCTLRYTMKDETIVLPESMAVDSIHGEEAEERSKPENLSRVSVGAPVERKVAEVKPFRQVLVEDKSAVSVPVSFPVQPLEKQEELEPLVIHEQHIPDATETDERDIHAISAGGTEVPSEEIDQHQTKMETDEDFGRGTATPVSQVMSNLRPSQPEKRIDELVKDVTTETAENKEMVMSEKLSKEEPKPTASFVKKDATETKVTKADTVQAGRLPFPQEITKQTSSVTKKDVSVVKEDLAVSGQTEELFQEISETISPVTKKDQSVTEEVSGGAGKLSEKTQKTISTLTKKDVEQVTKETSATSILAKRFSGETPKPVPSRQSTAQEIGQIKAKVTSEKLSWESSKSSNSVTKKDVQAIVETNVDSSQTEKLLKETPKPVEILSGKADHSTTIAAEKTKVTSEIHSKETSGKVTRSKERKEITTNIDTTTTVLKTSKDRVEQKESQTVVEPASTVDIRVATVKTPDKTLQEQQAPTAQTPESPANLDDLLLRNQKYLEEGVRKKLMRQQHVASSSSSEADKAGDGSLAPPGGRKKRISPVMRRRIKERSKSRERAEAEKAAEAEKEISAAELLASPEQGKTGEITQDVSAAKSPPLSDILDGSKKRTDSDSTLTSVTGSEDHLSKKKRKDKSSLRKSQLNTSAKVDLGTETLTRQDGDLEAEALSTPRSERNKTTPVTPEEVQQATEQINRQREEVKASTVEDGPLPKASHIAPKQFGVDSAAKRELRLLGPLPSRVSSALSKFQGAENTKSDARPKVDDLSKSAKRFARGKDFSSLIEKFSSKSESSEESDRRAKIITRKLDLPASFSRSGTPSSDESNAEADRPRRTPERTGSLKDKLRKFEGGAPIKLPQRASSFKSDANHKPDFMRMIKQQQQQADKPAEKLSAPANQQNKNKTSSHNEVQKQKTADVSRSGGKESQIHILEQKLSKAKESTKVEEVIKDQQLIDVLNSRRKLSDAEYHDALEDLEKLENGNGKCKTAEAEIKEVIADEEVARALQARRKDTDSKLGDQEELFEDSVETLDTNKGNGLKSTSKNGSAGSTKVKSVSGGREETVNLTTKTDIKKKDEVVPKKKDDPKPKDDPKAKEIQESPQKSEKLSEKSSNVDSTKVQQQQKVNSSSRQNGSSEVQSKPSSVVKQSSLDKPVRSILKRSSSSQESGPIIDPQLAAVLQGRRRIVESSDVTEETVKEDKRDVIRQEIAQTEIHKGSDDEEEEERPVSIAERIFMMENRIEEAKSCPVTPRTRSGFTTPRSRARSGASTPRRESLESLDEEQRPRTNPLLISDKHLMAKLEKMAEKEERTEKRARHPRRSRDDWRTRTLPVTLEEIQEADSLESVSSFRGLVRRKATINILEQIKEQDKKTMINKKTEFPQPFRRERRSRRSVRSKTAPITAAELGSIPEGNMLLDPLRHLYEPLSAATSKADSGILSGSDVSRESIQSDSSRSLEMEMPEDDPARLSVSARTSIFKQLEEQARTAKKEKPKKQSIGVKRMIEKKKRERSRTQPITEDEVKTASEFADTDKNQSGAAPSSGNRTPKDGSSDSDDELSRLSLADKLKLFSKKPEEQVAAPPPRSNAPVIRKRNRKQVSRFNTQPITTEEVKEASRISPLALSMAKPPDNELLRSLPIAAQIEMMAQHAEAVLSQPSSRAGSRAGSQPGSRRSSVGAESLEAEDTGILKTSENKDPQEVKSILKHDGRKPSDSEIRGILKDVGKDSAEPRGILKHGDSEGEITSLTKSPEEPSRGILKHADSNDSQKGHRSALRRDSKGKSEGDLPRSILKRDSLEENKVEPDKGVLKKSRSQDFKESHEIRGILKKTPSSEVRSASCEVTSEERDVTPEPVLARGEEPGDQAPQANGTERVTSVTVEAKSETVETRKTSKIKNEAVARRRSREARKAETERYRTQPADTGASEKTPEQRRLKYGATRHHTQPITPEEKEAAEAKGSDMSHNSGSITERLNQLKKSGEEDWKRRIRPELGLPEDVQMRVKKGPVLDRPNSIADRLCQLGESQQRWTARVEENDAQEFTVEGKQNRNMCIALDSPVSTRKRRLPKRELSFGKGDSAPSEDGSPLPSPSRERIPLPTDLISEGPPVVSVSKSSSSSKTVITRVGGEEDREVENAFNTTTVELPDLGEESFNTFFSRVHDGAEEKIDVSLDDFDQLFLKAEDVLTATRRIRPKRRHIAQNRNPLKTQSVEIHQEYTEIRTGVADLELKRIRREGIAKDSSTAQVMLAEAAVKGLQSTESFNIELRKTKDSKAQTPGGSDKFLPYKDRMLLHIKGRRHVQTRLVQPCVASVNSGDSYILVMPDRVVNWNGKFSNVIEKARAADIAQFISQKKDLGYRASAAALTVEDEKMRHVAMKNFWSALDDGGECQECGPPDEDEDYEAFIVETNMVYKVCNNTLVPYEEYWGRIPKVDMLIPQEVLVFDFGSELYVWHGHQVSMEQRKMGMKLATQLWERGYDYSMCDVNPISALRDEGSGGPPKKSSSRPSWAVFGKVNQNMETTLFKEKFFDWPESSRFTMRSKTPESFALKQVESDLKPYDAKLLIPVNKGPVTMMFEGSHVGRGDKWIEEMDGLRREFEILTLDVIVWHVLEYDHSKLPKHSYGQFHDGDTYVVRWQYMITAAGLKTLKGHAARHSLTGRERCAYFFWQGDNSTVNEKGASALMTVELDEERGPQVRVSQGKEPPCFLNLFDGRTVVHIGKREEAETNTQGAYRLYLVRNELENEMCLMEVPVGTQNLRSRTSFLLLNVKTGFLYIWHGAKSPAHTRALAVGAANKLKETCPLEIGLHSKASVMITELEEGSEKSEFWSAMRSKDRKLYHSLLKGKKLRESPRLFYMNSVAGVFEAVEILNPARCHDLQTTMPFHQSDLYKVSQPGLFLLDNHDEVYLWQGWWPEGDEDSENVHTGSALARFNTDRRCAMQTTIHYCQEKSSSRPPKAYLVFAGLEPLAFTNLFPAWTVEDEAKESSLRDGRKQGETISVEELLAKLTQSQYTLAELQERPLPEGVDPLKLETYLRPDEFEEVLDMPKEDFYALPSWKQTKLKQKVGLF